MKALITGISGQDGSYLSELLLEKGYEVHGIVRRNSIPENQDRRISHLNVKTYYGDVLDKSSLTDIILEIKPDEIYNLAAMSHVRISFDVPEYTIQTNSVGVLNLLEICRRFLPDVRFYQASSSEMFGNSIDEDGFQRETTPMNPASPYGCSKLMAHSLAKHYRSAYGLFICSGILFNHESPRRGINFVTNKVVKAAIDIKKGTQTKLELGNLDSFRDWGHVKDYVRAMHMMINHVEPDDFVIATGKSHSVRELCEYVFGKLDMDYKDYVVQNPKYLRPEEIIRLRGDSSKARAILGWEPEYTFEQMLDEMIGIHE
jgi:GDPmannose 4,6-dehydratase